MNSKCTLTPDGTQQNVGPNEIYIEQASSVSHFGLAIYMKKYLKAKRRRIMETQIFHHAKI
jgi:hypothetical protein